VAPTASAYRSANFNRGDGVISCRLRSGLCSASTYQILCGNVRVKTYGVIFTPHNGADAAFALGGRHRVTWLMPSIRRGGTYLASWQAVCLVVSGWEHLCGQFAPPGAEYAMGYLPDGSPHPASLVFPTAGAGINAGVTSRSRVRVIYFGSSSPPARCLRHAHVSQ
jgi:hypothetical protein